MYDLLIMKISYSVDNMDNKLSFYIRSPIMCIFNFSEQEFKNISIIKINVNIPSEGNTCKTPHTSKYLKREHRRLANIFELDELYRGT